MQIYPKLGPYIDRVKETHSFFKKLDAADNLEFYSMMSKVWDLWLEKLQAEMEEYKEMDKTLGERLWELRSKLVKIETTLGEADLPKKKKRGRPKKEEKDLAERVKWLEINLGSLQEGIKSIVTKVANLEVDRNQLKAAVVSLQVDSKNMAERLSYMEDRDAGQV